MGACAVGRSTTRIRRRPSRALFAPVWYEGYAEPTLSWQSSAASTDAEPKFSLIPLMIGTLKAALYSMFFAIPVALFGAIYTAYFMAPLLRAWVKPTIEIMAALPTVILGFLAGLRLAPIVERELAAVLSFLALTPLLCIATGMVVRRLPCHLHAAIPDGWQALAMLPLLIGCAFAAAGLGLFRTRPSPAAICATGCARATASTTSSATPSSSASPWASP